MSVGSYSSLYDIRKTLHSMVEMLKYDKTLSLAFLFTVQAQLDVQSSAGPNSVAVCPSILPDCVNKFNYCYGVRNVTVLHFP